MPHKKPSALHTIACSCSSCTPCKSQQSRARQILHAITRASLIIAAIIAIPFAIAWAIASANSANR